MSPIAIFLIGLGLGTAQAIVAIRIEARIKAAKKKPRKRRSDYGTTRPPKGEQPQ